MHKCHKCGGNLVDDQVTLAWVGLERIKCKSRRCIECGEHWTKPGDIVNALAGGEARADGRPMISHDRMVAVAAQVGIREADLPDVQHAAAERLDPIAELMAVLW